MVRSSYNRYNGFEISIIENAMKTTHVVLGTSPFVTSHTMVSVLDCAKPFFDHNFDSGCTAIRGADRQLVCSGRSQVLFLFLGLSFFNMAVPGRFRDLMRASDVVYDSQTCVIVGLQSKPWATRWWTWKSERDKVTGQCRMCKYACASCSCVVHSH